MRENLREPSSQERRLGVNMFEDRSTLRNQEYRIGKIIQSDPANQIVIMQDRFMGLFQISLHIHDSISIMPQVGEVWMVKRIGIDWVLDKRVENGTESVVFSDLSPGDRLIYSPSNLIISASGINVSGISSFDDEVTFSTPISPESIQGAEVDDLQIFVSKEGSPHWADPITIPAITVTEADIEQTFTAKGQVYVGTGNKSGILLPSGTLGSVFTTTSGGIAWRIPSPANTVSGTFPSSPVIGQMFTLKNNYSNLSFTYDGSNWYSEPQIILQDPSNRSTSNTSFASLNSGSMIYIKDAIGAGCTVQLRIDSQPSSYNYGGATSTIRVYYNTSTIGGTSWGSDIGISATDLNRQNGSSIMQASVWGDGPSTGDFLRPSYWGKLSSTDADYCLTKETTIWMRFKK